MAIFAKALRTWAPDDDRWYRNPNPPTVAGVPVSEVDALKYTAVFACISLVAGDIAKLPLILFKRNPDGSRERAVDKPLYHILRSAPNDEMNSFNWRESKQGHLMSWGNTYDQISRNNLNEITGLWQIAPETVEPFRNKSNKIYYKWKGNDGEEIIKPKEDVFHIPGYGFNGLMGMSLIALARESIGLGLAAETFGSNYFGKGTHPAGVLESDHLLGDKKADFIKNFKEQYTGLGQSHSVVLLEGGIKYKGITVPLEDCQFLETRNFQQLEICGFYHVPPHKIAIHGANSNYNNLEQENQNYIDACLSHWIVRWEQSADQQLLTETERKAGYFVKFELKGLLRGDSEARSKWYQMFLNNGFPLNNILALEDMNPVEGGNVGRVPLNMVSVDVADEVQTEKVSKPITKEEAKSFFSPENTRKKQSEMGIIVRDRIMKQYYPLFQDIAETIVNRESKAVKRRAEYRDKEARSKSSMRTWLKEFYDKMPEYIRKKFGPTFKSFAEAINIASGEEIGVTPENIDEFVRDYTERYAERHSESSEGQLLALLDEEEGFEKIDTRVDEWQGDDPDVTPRSEKIALNETNRLMNAVFQTVAFGAGLGTIWRIRGAETCPYCRSLNGKRITKGQSYVKNGDVLNPDGADYPMNVNGTKKHCPLHYGCDCYTVAG